LIVIEALTGFTPNCNLFELTENTLEFVLLLTPKLLAFPTEKFKLPVLEISNPFWSRESNPSLRSPLTIKLSSKSSDLVDELNLKIPEALATLAEKIIEQVMIVKILNFMIKITDSFWQGD